jgi:hypothetical protein
MKKLFKVRLWNTQGHFFIYVIAKDKEQAEQKALKEYRYCTVTSCVHEGEVIP